MKLLYLPILALLFLAAFTPAFAIEQPRIVPRANEVPKPIDEVFARLKKYFSDPNNHFELVSADLRKHTDRRETIRYRGFGLEQLGVLQDRPGRDDLQVRGRHRHGDRQARENHQALDVRKRRGRLPGRLPSRLERKQSRVPIEIRAGGPDPRGGRRFGREMIHVIS